MRGGVTDPDARPAAGATVTVATRPERLQIVPTSESSSGGMGLTEVPGRVTQGTYLGDQTEYRVHTEQAGELIVRHQNAMGAGGALGVGPGDPVIVRWQEDANLILAG